jgi:hypothetical protein
MKRCILLAAATPNFNRVAEIRFGAATQATIERVAFFALAGVPFSVFPIQFALLRTYAASLPRSRHFVKVLLFRLSLALPALIAATAADGPKAGFLQAYQGTPYHDSRYQGGAQRIPGRVHCAYYDLGGEGLAYHDSDAKNNGSGTLNPADGSYLNEFRIAEGVDISYTKFKRDPEIDDNPYDKVIPLADMLYVGWTEPGEWFNVTVNVVKEGNYAADLLYTSNRGGAISIDVNGEAATGPLTILSTYDDADPVAWRQWHHWNIAPDIAKLHLAKGKNVLTVHIVAQGQMNLATFNFKRVK